MKQVLSLVEIIRADVSRNDSTLVRLFLAEWRIADSVLRSNAPPAIKTLIKVVHFFVSKSAGTLSGGGEIPLGCRIGPGLRLAHGLSGIVIVRDAVIGANVSIYHQVTVGSQGRVGGDHLAPHIGDDVTIFPGAKVFGRICVGSGAVIGANAVVMEDVPPGGLAMTASARIVSPELRRGRSLP